MTTLIPSFNSLTDSHIKHGVMYVYLQLKQTFNSLTDSHFRVTYPSVASAERVFQFPNGFSQGLGRGKGRGKRKYFQFPNGFSLKPYIPVPLSGCVHLTLSSRVI